MQRTREWHGMLSVRSEEEASSGHGSETIPQQGEAEECLANADVRGRGG